MSDKKRPEGIFGQFALIFARGEEGKLRGMVLVGEKGVGKTALVKQFIKINPIKKCLYISTKDSEEDSLYRELLKALNVNAINDDNLKLQLSIELEDSDMKLIFIDDAENLLPAKSEKIARQNIDLLIWLMDSIRIPIALIGNPDIEAFIKSDSQIERRLKIVWLYPFENDDEFSKFLSNFERDMPLTKASNIDKPPISDRIYELSKGNIGKISMIVKQSSIEAIKSGAEQVTLEIIDKLDKLGAFEQ